MTHHLKKGSIVLMIHAHAVLINTITYVMITLYCLFIFIYILSIVSNNEYKGDIAAINGCSEGIIVYFASSILLWFWTLVFKPIIPYWFYAANVVSPGCFIPFDETRHQKWEKHGCFVNFFTEYGFNERFGGSYRPTWSSRTLLIMFCVSVSVMNVSFAIDNNDNKYHNLMVGLSVGSTILIMVLQSLIFCCSKITVKDDLEEQEEKWWLEDIAFWWIGALVIWGIASIALFFVYMPYNGWSTENKFIIMRDIFYIVQGGFCFAMIPAAIIIKMHQCQCCIQVKDEIHNAKNAVGGSTVILDEVVTGSTV